MEQYVQAVAKVVENIEELKKLEMPAYEPLSPNM